MVKSVKELFGEKELISLGIMAKFVDAVMSSNVTDYLRNEVCSIITDKFDDFREGRCMDDRDRNNGEWCLFEYHNFVFKGYPYNHEFISVMYCKDCKKLWLSLLYSKAWVTNGSDVEIDETIRVEIKTNIVEAKKILDKEFKKRVGRDLNVMEALWNEKKDVERWKDGVV